MSEPNPYEPPRNMPSPTSLSLQKGTGPRYSSVRGFLLYWALCFFLWFFVAPLIAPTDPPLEGLPPVPTYLIAAQMIICYGLPLLLVWLDYRRTIDTE